MTEPLGVYVHIPFCARKCAYCDFLSFPSGEAERARYVGALIREIEKAGRQMRRPDPKRRHVDTIYIGGGTPSLLTGTQMQSIFSSIREAYFVDPDAEITIEGNPGTDLSALSFANRVSLGAQSMDDRELSLLGRIHTADEIRQAVETVRGYGIENLSLDLMFGIPGQTVESFLASLYEAILLSPTHLSLYSLRLEEGTPMYQRYALPEEEGMRDEERDADGPPLPDEDAEREMYHEAIQVLQSKGYHQYEISNFALPGMESRHNLRYWTGREYIGIGLGASSYADGVRWKNTDDLASYLEHPGDTRYEVERLNVASQMSEAMILGLRLTAGVSEEAFFERFRTSPKDVYGAIIARHEAKGLLTETDGRIRLTERGMDLANYVMCDFLPEPDK